MPFVSLLRFQCAFSFVAPLPGARCLSLSLSLSYSLTLRVYLSLPRSLPVEYGFEADWRERDATSAIQPGGGSSLCALTRNPSIHIGNWEKGGQIIIKHCPGDPDPALIYERTLWSKLAKGVKYEVAFLSFYIQVKSAKFTLTVPVSHLDYTRRKKQQRKYRIRPLWKWMGREGVCILEFKSASATSWWKLKTHFWKKCPWILYFLCVKEYMR